MGPSDYPGEEEEWMKTIKRMGAQGDVMFARVASVPPAAVQVEPSGDRHVLAHSETGHDHWTHAGRAKYFAAPKDPFTCYLQVTDEFADIVHARSFDTHKTLRLGRGTWLVRRQREYVPGGFRRVED
jgi:hypothetical protein